MAISSFEALGLRFKLSSEEEIANISARGPEIKKSKDTFLSQTFKIEENKVASFFSFLAQEPRYWKFLPLTIA